jgi:hypothetical protein
MADYLIHYNKNHNPKNGQFAPGDGNGDGIINRQTHNADGRKKGIYSAKIENYKKGTLFRKPYYIDKNGNKRSYESYNDMPVDAQNKERALAKGKKVAKTVGGVVLSTVAASAVLAGTIFVKSRLENVNLNGKPFTKGYYEI